MNRYRLDVNPSSYYAAQFRPEDIEITPYQAAGRYQFVDGAFVLADTDTPPRECFYLDEQPEYGAVPINGPMEFWLMLPSKEGHIESRYVDLAKTVLESIAEMDAAARDAPVEDTRDYEEHLGYVRVADRDGNVHLHYFANSVNTEWGVYFKMQPDGSWQLVTW